MQLRFSAITLLAAVLGGGAVTVGSEELRGATGTETRGEVQERVQERRRERRGQRQWIRVPQLTPGEALPLVGAPGVVIVDVTCREQGARIEDRIPGAIWQDCTQVDQWAHRYEGAKTLLVYCA